MQRTTARFPKHLFNELCTKAEADKVSLAEVIRVALSRYLHMPLDPNSLVFEVGRDGKSQSVTIPGAWLDVVQSYLRHDQPIPAIRELRTLSVGVESPIPPLGLYEAKCVIDILRADQRRRAEAKS